MIPDLSVLWVIALLLTCTFLLNTLIFKPILQVIQARTAAVTDARATAQTAAERVTTVTTDYTQKLNVARSDVYRQMDETRRVALEKRAALLSQTRDAVQQELSDAAGRVRQQSADARAMLDRDADAIAGTIVDRVLGRAPSYGR